MDSCSEVYNCIWYDPEGKLLFCKDVKLLGLIKHVGFVGAFHAAFLVWLGLTCGRIFVHHKDVHSRLRRLLLWGCAQSLLAGLLCGFSKDGGVIPVNKNLWSLSFILLQSGLGNILLSAFYIIVDVKIWWAGNPLRAMGMNSILLYCAHEIFGRCCPPPVLLNLSLTLIRFFPFYIQGPNTHSWNLFSNAFGCFCWVVIAYILYRKGHFFAI